MAPDSKRMTAISMIGGGLGAIALTLLMIIIGSYVNVHKVHAQVLATQEVEANSVCFHVSSIRQPDAGVVIDFEENQDVTLFVTNSLIQAPMTLITFFPSGGCQPYAIGHIMPKQPFGPLLEARERIDLIMVGEVIRQIYR